MFARYLKTTALFIAPIILLLAVMEVGLRRIPNDYSFKNARLLDDGTDFRLLILGSSHGYKGIDPMLFDLPGFNAANISQDLSYDRAILERYLPHLPSLEYIILPISYGSLVSNMATGKESWRVKNYTMYMGIDKDADKLADHLELLNRPMKEQISMLSDYYMLGKDNRSCQSSGVASQERRSGVDLQLTGIEAAARHYHPSKEATKRSISDLNAILALTSKNEIDVFLVTLPVWSSYRNELDTFQLQEVLSTCERLALGSPTVHYFDLLDDPRFGRTDFEDADHLSYSGSVKVSRILSQLIVETHPKHSSKP